MWLFTLGYLGKVGAWVISIPDPVLGGMTTFLFGALGCMMQALCCCRTLLPL